MCFIHLLKDFEHVSLQKSKTVYHYYSMLRKAIGHVDTL